MLTLSDNFFRPDDYHYIQQGCHLAFFEAACYKIISIGHFFGLFWVLKKLASFKAYFDMQAKPVILHDNEKFIRFIFENFLWNFVIIWPFSI
jgi:hypothetical protein